MQTKTPAPFYLVPLVGMLFCQVEGERTREVWLIDSEAWSLWLDGGVAGEVALVSEGSVQPRE